MARAVYEFKESSKQESWIQIGKHSHRIANNHAELLDKLSNDFPYCTQEKLLFLTSFIGAIILLTINPLSVISVLFRGKHEGGEDANT